MFNVFYLCSVLVLCGVMLGQLVFLFIVGEIFQEWVYLVLIVFLIMMVMLGMVLRWNVEFGVLFLCILQFEVMQILVRLMLNSVVSMVWLVIQIIGEVFSEELMFLVVCLSLSVLVIMWWMLWIVFYFVVSLLLWKFLRLVGNSVRWMDVLVLGWYMCYVFLVVKLRIGVSYFRIEVYNRLIVVSVVLCVSEDGGL